MINALENYTLAMALFAHLVQRSEPPFLCPRLSFPLFEIWIL
jgi:hypothetical protein